MCDSDWVLLNDVDGCEELPDNKSVCRLFLIAFNEFVMSVFYISTIDLAIKDSNTVLNIECMKGLYQ